MGARVDVDARPPSRFVAELMQLVMMEPTNRDREFVADFPPERAGLGETKMVRIGRRAAAHDAGLAGHEFAMVLVAQSEWSWLKDRVGRRRLAHPSRALVRLPIRTTGRTVRTRLERRYGSPAIGRPFAELRQSDPEMAFDEFASPLSLARSSRASSCEPRRPPRRPIAGGRVRRSTDRAAPRTDRAPAPAA